MKRFAIIVLIFLTGAAPAAAQDTWQNVDRVVAVGDVHGDFVQFVSLLQSAGLIDARTTWIGGKTHLVQLGDVPDRGPETRKIMDLLMDLEKQARRAGGAVHPLIGNHEAMNMYGDLRYTTPEEFASFQTPSSARLRDSLYRRHLEELATDSARTGKAEPDEAYRAQWYQEHPLGYFEHRMEFSPSGKYGSWIRSNDAVIRINDVLFLHGGIGPKYADSSRKQLNSRIRSELSDFTRLRGGVVGDPEGPLWYRGLAVGDEPELDAHVDRVLKTHGVRRIVIGHTTTDGAVMPRFGGRVLLDDVGLSAIYGSHPACLVIEGGKVYALHRGTKLEIPDDPGLPLLLYLRKAAALDPSPSPLLRAISELESRVREPVGR